MELKQFLQQAFKKTGALHHAYCIEGDRAEGFSTLAAFLREALDLSIQGNPDVWQGVFDVFGIDESRALAEFQSRKALCGGKKLCLIGARTMTREAQNALLKVFEEPAGDTHFFLFVPNAEVLLPTLRSRMMLCLRWAGSGACAPGIAESDEAAAFLKAPLAGRLAHVKKFVDTKEKFAAIAFLNNLEGELYRAMQSDADYRNMAAALSELTRCRSYLYDTASSVKLILEHIALVIPARR